MKTLDEAKEMGAIGYFEEVYKKINGKLRVLVLCPESIETKNVLRLETVSPFRALVAYITCVGQFTGVVFCFIIHGEVILKTL